MPFNFHVPLPGPFSYSKRIGGGPPGPGVVETAAGLAQRSIDLDTADRDEMFATYAARWIVLGGIALFLIVVLGGTIPTLLGSVLLGAVAWAQVWRNRRRARLSVDQPPAGRHRQ